LKRLPFLAHLHVFDAPFCARACRCDEESTFVADFQIGIADFTSFAGVTRR
jgi:hypothetical protein